MPQSSHALAPPHPPAHPHAATAHHPATPTLGPRLTHHLRTRPLSPTPLTLITIRTTPPEDPTIPCVGPVCIERIAPNALHTLTDDPTVLQADLPNTYRPRLDQADAQIGARAARQEYGLTGHGILIAIIDTGLDWTHPDFIDPDGQTRVAWLLDQTLPPDGRHPELTSLGGGAVFEGIELQTALDAGEGPAVGAGLDPIGHGTHVAGIAASDDPVYTGVAPGARLVVVKAMDASGAGFSEDQLVAALAFAHRVAELEGRPLVVNLSLGNQMGAHDGTEPLELALESLSELSFPPCAIAVAAGNEGLLHIHARGAVRADGEPLIFTLLVPQTEPPSPSKPARIALDFWLEAEPGLQVSLRGPSGWRSDPITIGDRNASSTSWSPDGMIAIDTPADPMPLNGLWRVTVQLSGEAGLPLSSGSWSLAFAGDASRVDGWIGEWDLLGGPGPHFADHLDPHELVGPPATARGVVAVGAFVSRTSWPGADDREHQLAQVVVGEASDFSVSGPTRDGRFKPELLAPGQAVAASLSAQADPRSPGSMFYASGSLRRMLPDGRHGVANGTSMASPFVAGALALAFEGNPMTTGAKLHGLIRVSTASDVATGTSLFEPSMGFGKLSVPHLLAGPSAANPIDPTVSLCGAAKDWLATAAGQQLQIAAVPRAADGRTLGPGLQVDITAAGEHFDGPVRDRGYGLYTRSLIGTGSRGRSLHMDCLTDGQTYSAHPQIHLAASHDEAHGGGVQGGAGSCATTAPGPHGLLLALGLACLQLWPLGRRYRGRRFSGRRSSPNS